MKARAGVSCVAVAGKQRAVGSRVRRWLKGGMRARGLGAGSHGGRHTQVSGRAVAEPNLRKKLVLSSASSASLRQVLLHLTTSYSIGCRLGQIF